VGPQLQRKPIIFMVGFFCGIFFVALVPSDTVSVELTDRSEIHLDISQISLLCNLDYQRERCNAFIPRSFSFSMYELEKSRNYSSIPNNTKQDKFRLKIEKSSSKKPLEHILPVLEGEVRMECGFNLLWRLFSTQVDN
jgi:hypothetical protein